jgi:DNA-binding NtrC family response regulator
LQEGEIEPLGSNQVVSFDARVIAATSRDLAALVRAGQFREDLFYRLNVLPLRVPPLRERRGDIAALVEVLAEDMVQQASGAGQIEVTADGLALLGAQHWRGNIRELRNVLEQAAMRSESQTIDAKQLEAVLREAGVPLLAQAAPFSAYSSSGPSMDIAVEASGDSSDSSFTRPLSLQIAEVEQRAIQAAMRATQGNKLATSRLLGISRATLYERLENPEN